MLVLAATVGSGAGPAAGPPPILGRARISHALSSTAPAVRADAKEKSRDGERFIVPTINLR